MKLKGGFDFDGGQHEPLTDIAPARTPPDDWTEIAERYLRTRGHSREGLPLAKLVPERAWLLSGHHGACPDWVDGWLLGIAEQQCEMYRREDLRQGKTGKDALVNFPEAAKYFVRYLSSVPSQEPKGRARKSA